MSCAAAGCTNRTSTGFRTFRFPADKQRRNVWICSCRRKDWEPTAFSRLCEVHFEDSQWECNRIDGKKKLKWNAVPTKFYLTNPAKILSYKWKSVYKIRPDRDTCNASFTLENPAKIISVSPPEPSETDRITNIEVPATSDVNSREQQIPLVSTMVVFHVHEK